MNSTELLYAWALVVCVPTIITASESQKENIQQSCPFDNWQTLNTSSDSADDLLACMNRSWNVNEENKLQDDNIFDEYSESLKIIIPNRTKLKSPKRSADTIVDSTCETDTSSISTLSKSSSEKSLPQAAYNSPTRSKRQCTAVQHDDFIAFDDVEKNIFNQTLVQKNTQLKKQAGHLPNLTTIYQQLDKEHALHKEKYGDKKFGAVFSLPFRKLCVQAIKQGANKQDLADIYNVSRATLRQWHDYPQKYEIS